MCSVCVCRCVWGGEQGQRGRGGGRDRREYRRGRVLYEPLLENRFFCDPKKINHSLANGAAK